MEGSGRRLGWIAIALSVVALVVSFSGRAHRGYDDRGGFYPPQAPYSQPAPAGPQGQFDPRGQFGPPAPAPHGRFDGRGQFGPQGPFDGRGGPRPFFMLPFMLIGGLFKLLFVALLIWLGLRLIKGRGFGGPWGRGPGGGRWGNEQGQPGRPGEPGSRDPEQPPYTGDTQQM